MISILKICGPKLLSEETQAGAANAETPVSQKAERYNRRCMLPESQRRLLLRLHRVERLFTHIIESRGLQTVIKA